MDLYIQSDICIRNRIVYHPEQYLLNIVLKKRRVTNLFVPKKKKKLMQLVIYLLET